MDLITSANLILKCCIDLVRIDCICPNQKVQHSYNTRIANVYLVGMT